MLTSAALFSSHSRTGKACGAGSSRKAPLRSQKAKGVWVKVAGCRSRLTEEYTAGANGPGKEECQSTKEHRVDEEGFRQGVRGGERWPQPGRLEGEPAGLHILCLSHTHPTQSSFTNLLPSLEPLTSVLFLVSSLSSSCVHFCTDLEAPSDLLLSAFLKGLPSKIKLVLSSQPLKSRNSL